jgi:hypothetical protein
VASSSDSTAPPPAAQAGADTTQGAAAVDTTRSCLAITLKMALKSMRFLATDPRIVFFVRLEDGAPGGDAYLQTRIYDSMLAKGADAYLLDTPPGTYAAVGAYYTVSAESTSVFIADGGQRLVYFERKLVEGSTIKVAPGAVAYMGRYQVDEEDWPKNADSTQIFYRREIAPRMVHSRQPGGLFELHIHERGTFHRVDTSAENRERFVRRARKHLAKTSWAARLE